MPKIIYGYMREFPGGKWFLSKGRRVGVFAAYVSSENEIVVGWSKCNIKRDKFDKGLGQRIALGRAGLRIIAKIPQKYEPEVMMMVERAKKYFKGAHVAPYLLEYLEEYC